jgi:hypothetical protein
MNKPLNLHRLAFAFGGILLGGGSPARRGTGLRVSRPVVTQAEAPRIGEPTFTAGAELPVLAWGEDLRLRARRKQS